jgi:hypothetical protein
MANPSGALAAAACSRATKSRGRKGVSTGVETRCVAPAAPAWRSAARMPESGPCGTSSGTTAQPRSANRAGSPLADRITAQPAGAAGQDVADQRLAGKRQERLVRTAHARPLPAGKDDPEDAQADAFPVISRRRTVDDTRKSCKPPDQPSTGSPFHCTRSTPWLLSSSSSVMTLVLAPGSSANPWTAASGTGSGAGIRSQGSRFRIDAVAEVQNAFPPHHWP